MIDIRLPELSASMTEATLVAWLVNVGDPVAPGDVVAEFETDKSTVELEAEAGGVLAEILVAEGTEGVAVGTVLARVDERGEAAEPEPARPAPPDAPAAAAPSAPGTVHPLRPPARESGAPGPSAAAGAPPAPAAPAEAETTRVSPLARRMAAQASLDLATISGSGSGGRIVRDDVERALDAAPPAAERAAEPDAPHRVERLGPARRTAAERLAEAKRVAPHFYLDVECDAERLLDLRRELNTRRGGEEGPKLTLNDLLVRAMALALREVPEANVAWHEGSLRVFERVDVAVAVASERGLVTPVVRGADRRSVLEIAADLRDLVERARQGRLRPEEYAGGTATLSNLGMYGVRRLFPILNPPQACILGIGAVEPRAVAHGSDLAVRRTAIVTMSADHRALDGATGGELLRAFRRLVEDPLSILL